MSRYLFFIAILAYSILLIYLGRYSAKKNRKAEEYFHAGRKGSVFNIVISAASLWGAITLVSEFESSFVSGISVIWYGIGTLFMTVLIATLVLAPLRKKEVITLSGYLGDKFGEPARALSGVIIGLFMPIFSIGTVAVLAQILRVMYGIPVWESVTLCSVVLLGYVLFGGMQSINLTGAINTIVMYIGIGVLTITVIYYTGFNNLMTKLPANYYSLTGVGIPMILVWLGTWVVNALVAQTELQMLLTCKDERVGKKGVYWSIIALIIMTILAPLTGMGLRLLFPAQTDGVIALAYFIKDKAPLWIGILATLSIWSASLVWAAPCQFSGASSLGRDIGKALGISQSQQKEKTNTQISLFILTVILIIFATLRPSQAAWWSVFAFSVRNASCMVLMLGALIWPAMNKRTAYLSMAIGGITSFTWYAMAAFSPTHFYHGIHPMWIGMSAALVSASIWMALETIVNNKAYAFKCTPRQKQWAVILSVGLIAIGIYILVNLAGLISNGIIGASMFIWSVILFCLSTISIKEAVAVKPELSHKGI